MRVAILGDIHGNASALRAVLDAAEREGVEMLLVTGDLVGYYFEPAEVLALLEPWPRRMVRGNHEAMLAQARRDPGRLAAIEAKYGSGIRAALEQLSAAQLDALENLPHPESVAIAGRGILLCHGAPWDLDCYVYPDAPQDTLLRCARTDEEIVAMGHTHYPMLRRLDGRILLNPGSVGQPRDRLPGACWALLDAGSGEIGLRREGYDIETTANEARRRHPELPYLADVLTRT
ncbi:MAG TPA: metallophosphoesterase family protein [Paucimonas sp.]|nr:metallophosphoesterase family protein [Paucimonas sp.]